MSIRDEKNSEHYEPDGRRKFEPTSVENSTRTKLHCHRLHLTTQPDINRLTNVDFTSCLKNFKRTNPKLQFLSSWSLKIGTSKHERLSHTD